MWGNNVACLPWTEIYRFHKTITCDLTLAQHSRTGFGPLADCCVKVILFAQRTDFVEWSRQTEWKWLQWNFNRNLIFDQSVALHRGQCSHHDQQQPHLSLQMPPTWPILVTLWQFSPNDWLWVNVILSSLSVDGLSRMDMPLGHASLQWSRLRNGCLTDYSVNKITLCLPVCLLRSAHGRHAMSMHQTPCFQKPM